MLIVFSILILRLKKDLMTVVHVMENIQGTKAVYLYHRNVYQMILYKENHKSCNKHLYINSSQTTFEFYRIVAV